MVYCKMDIDMVVQITMHPRHDLWSKTDHAFYFIKEHILGRLVMLKAVTRGQKYSIVLKEANAETLEIQGKIRKVARAWPPWWPLKFKGFATLVRKKWLPVRRSTHNEKPLKRWNFKGLSGGWSGARTLDTLPAIWLFIRCYRVPIHVISYSYNAAIASCPGSDDTK